MRTLAESLISDIADLFGVLGGEEQTCRVDAGTGRRCREGIPSGDLDQGEAEAEVAGNSKSGSSCTCASEHGIRRSQGR